MLCEGGGGERGRLDVFGGVKCLYSSANPWSLVSHKVPSLFLGSTLGITGMILECSSGGQGTASPRKGNFGHFDVLL